MPLVPLVLALALGLAHLRAVRAEDPARARLLKPLPVLVAMAWVLLGTPPGAAGTRWVALGLALSMAGDVLLALPRERFLEGLVAFLLAHLAYARAFAGRAPWACTPWLVLGLLLYAGLALRAILPGTGPLRGAVLAYMAAIAAMAWLAGEAWVAHPGPATACGFLGAALFMVSDTMLAWDRFRAPLAARSELVMGTYYAAQLLIASSCA